MGGADAGKVRKAVGRRERGGERERCGVEGWGQVAGIRGGGEGKGDGIVKEGDGRIVGAGDGWGWGGGFKGGPMDEEEGSRVRGELFGIGSRGGLREGWGEGGKVEGGGVWLRGDGKKRRGG